MGRDHKIIVILSYLVYYSSLTHDITVSAQTSKHLMIVTFFLMWDVTILIKPLKYFMIMTFFNNSW